MNDENRYDEVLALAHEAHGQRVREGNCPASPDGSVRPKDPAFAWLDEST